MQVSIVVTSAPRSVAALAVPVRPPVAVADAGGDNPAEAGERSGAVLATDWPLAQSLLPELEAFLRDVGHRGGPGAVHALPRPTRQPAQVLLVGTGDGGARSWREAGAALARAAADRIATLTVALAGAPGGAAAAAGELALGVWLALYRYRLGADPTPGRMLGRVTLAVAADDVDACRNAVARAKAIVDAVVFARDLTNTPSAVKSPKWFADRIASAAARRPGVSLKIVVVAELAAGGFGGVLAVGNGSPRPPRLVEVSWRPRGARTHVVLVGKGICFDSGGISIKPRDAMKLMRKDMGGAAAVCATVLAAADLALPIRVTALAPLAENMVSGSSMRPGDVIRHYGGVTTEVLDTDAEGRLVLGDALAYAVRRRKPDYLIDLATLTGASHVALGKRIAALFSPAPALADALAEAGEQAGEPLWRLPLHDDYLGLLRSDVADLANIGQPAQAGAVTAALYLREFTGDCRDRWAHIDMSAPSWSDRNDGPLVKGATGWGVRMLVQFLSTLSERG
jgi:leucyl aminopeptidase